MTYGLPIYYVVKNRNNIYRSNYTMKFYYAKEVFARIFFGLVIGYASAMMIYGLGPVN